MSDQVRAIKKAINDAYETGEIQTFEDLKKVFLRERDFLGVDNSRLRGATFVSVCAKNPVVVALRQKEAEANRPITDDSPIEDLPISSRISLALRRKGLQRVGDLNPFLKEEKYGLIHISYIGKQRAEEIYEALKWAGIEIPKPSEFSGQEGREGAEGFGEARAEERAAESELHERTLSLKAGEVFTTGFSSRVIVLSATEALIIFARKITVVAEG